jgi:hypothetical protein
MLDVFTRLNNYVPCSDCGNIVTYDIYNFDENKCMNCFTTEWLWTPNIFFNSRETDIPEHNCSICQDVVKYPYTTRCNHVFHRRCLAKLQDFPLRCPNCRACLFEEDEDIDYSDMEDEEERDEEDQDEEERDELEDREFEDRATDVEESSGASSEESSTVSVEDVSLKITREPEG